MKPSIKILQRGFTLLEILLVMLILAGVASMVILTLPDQRQYELKRTMDKLALQIDKVSDNALIQRKIYGLLITEESYDFLYLDKDKWQSLAKKPIILPQNTNFQIQHIEGNEITNSKKNKVKKVTGLEVGEEAGEAENATNTEQLKPQIWFWTDGTVTPFELLISNSGLQYQLSVNAFGKVIVDRNNSEGR